MRLEKIKVSDIKHGDLIRPNNAGDIDALAASLKGTGQIVPVMVQKVNGHYETVFGNRRVTAARKAGIKELAAIIIEEGATKQQAMALALIENMAREDMTTLEKAEGIKAYKKLTGLDNKSIGKMVGLGESRVEALLQLASEPAEIKALMTLPLRAGGGSTEAIPERTVYRSNVTGIRLQDRVALLKAAQKNNLTSDEVAARAKLLTKTKDSAAKRRIVEAVSGDPYIIEKNLEEINESYKSSQKRIEASPKLKKELNAIVHQFKDLSVCIRNISRLAGDTLYSPESVKFLERRCDESIRSLESVKKQISKRGENAR